MCVEYAATATLGAIAVLTPDAMQDTGLFGVYVVAGEKSLEEMMYRLTFNITRICHEVSSTCKR